MPPASPAPASRYPAPCRNQLEQLLVLQQLFNAGIWATDAEGRAIADVPRSTGRLGVNYSDREYIQSTLRHNRPTVATPIMGRVVNAWIIVIAVPVNDEEGNVIGTLCGGVRLDLPNFLDPITRHRHGKTGGYLLIAPEQRLVIVATDQRRNMEILQPHGVNPETDRWLDGHRGTQVRKTPTALRFSYPPTAFLPPIGSLQRPCQPKKHSLRSPTFTAASWSRQRS